MSAPSDSHLPSTSAPHDEQPPRRIWFVVSVVAVVVLLGGWVYVLFFYDPGLLIDELADREFPEAAERICAEAAAQFDELPLAAEAATHLDRADTVETSNRIFTEMLDRLEPIVPTEPANVRAGVTEWLDDWRTYVEDRRSYVERLREDPEARFLESPKAESNRGITRAIDSFAQVNTMESCTTPGDVS